MHHCWRCGRIMRQSAQQASLIFAYDAPAVAARENMALSSGVNDASALWRRDTPLLAARRSSNSSQAILAARYSCWGRKQP